VTLHLVQLFPSGADLARFGHARGLPDDDPGYLLHRALRDAFGAAAPQPFRLLDAPDRPTRVLGYGSADAPALREAMALAEPDLDRVFPPERIDSKPLPERLDQGATLAFEARLCPLVRTKSPADPGRLRELDAFLHRALASPGTALDRETVYTDWLRDKLANGGAELRTARMTAFALAPLVRRAHASSIGRSEVRDGPPRRLLSPERKGASRRPDVTFRGTLRVAEPERFRELLARGVGRHRAFGFGMLLLRRGGA
jgi:CRISPR system Cascade subunit CasE